MKRIRSGLTSHVACLVLATCGLGILCLGSPSPVNGASRAPTALTLDLPSEAKIGQDVMVVARLTSGGLPVTSRRVSFLLHGTLLGASGVDANGVADFRIRGTLLSTAGQASVSAVFEGSSSLGRSEAARLLNLTPAEITIRTVPAIDGIPIRLGQQEVVTLDGAVAFAVPTIGSYDLAPDIQAGSDAATRTEFVRWSDNVFTATRTLAVEGDAVLELGLHIARRGSIRFLDQDGDPVDSSRIERVTLTSTGGTEQTFTDFDEVWLEAETVVKQLDSLVITERNWRVLDVQIAGTNVVNRGQQHLAPAPDSVWEVVVLLYDLEVAPVDALFGTDVHGTIDLTYPDGTVQTESIDPANRTLAFASLPRGNYTLRLHTAGLGAPTPVVLSRDQTASIRVITYVDLGILGSVLLGGVAMLLWIGRRQQILATAERIRATTGGWSSWAPRTVEWLETHVGRRWPSAPPTIRRPNVGKARTLNQARPTNTAQQARTSGGGLAAPMGATPGAPRVADGRIEQRRGRGKSRSQAYRPEPPPQPVINRNIPLPPGVVDDPRLRQTGLRGPGGRIISEEQARALQTPPAIARPPIARPVAAASPQPRVCRRCGNRIPDSERVCARCAIQMRERP